MGFSVTAIDASAAMIDRTRALAAAHNAKLSATTCSWEDIPGQHFEPFDAVLCVGNSLAHASGRAGRQAALAAMAGALRDHGLFVVTSRNWEQVRRRGSTINVDQRATERDGRSGLVIRAWTIPDTWEQPHDVDVAVAFLDHLPVVTADHERLTFWPFTHQALEQDLHAAGFTLSASTYTANAERYVVTCHKTTM
jgi:SAM-dependent methyltransferase